MVTYLQAVVVQDHLAVGFASILECRAGDRVTIMTTSATSKWWLCKHTRADDDDRDHKDTSGYVSCFDLNLVDDDNVHTYAPPQSSSLSSSPKGLELIEHASHRDEQNSANGKGKTVRSLSKFFEKKTVSPATPMKSPPKSSTRVSFFQGLISPKSQLQISETKEETSEKSGKRLQKKKQSRRGKSEPPKEMLVDLKEDSVQVPMEADAEEEVPMGTFVRIEGTPENCEPDWAAIRRRKKPTRIGAATVDGVLPGKRRKSKAARTSFADLQLMFEENSPSPSSQSPSS